MRIPIRILAAALLTAGLSAVGYVAYTVVDARVYQAEEQRRFDAAVTAKAAVDVAVYAAAPAGLFRGGVIDGGVIGEMRIPRIGLAAMVAQGDSASILARAVGHLAETALPGDAGNVVLAGHRDTFFRPLKDVRIGDAITIRTVHGDVGYVVEWTAVVSPDQVQVIAPTDHEALTLITCFPFSFIGSAPDRFIVRARRLVS